MRDEAALRWPFFDEEHRAFARDFEAWLDARPFGGGSGAWPRGGDDAAVRARVGALGAGGWLRERDLRTRCLAREALAYRDGLDDFAFAIQALGAAPIARFGSEEQRAAWLAPIERGDAVAAFALSERDAGSDVAAIATTARRDAGGYVIEGEKAWISNAGVADLYVVFARTGEERHSGLSAFVVGAGAPGLTVSERVETLSPHPLGMLRFTRCRVPHEALLGDEGGGFGIAMATLERFRCTVGAAALGFARRALDESLAHVNARRAFGAPLAALQMTQAAIAQMVLDVDASALLVYRAAWSADAGEPRITREASLAKWHATEAAGRVVDRAVQLFGARGVTRGEIAERLYRDVRALRIYEGASEVQQVIVARHVLAPKSP